MANSPAPQEQGALEQAGSWLKDWWGGKSKEERFATMWRLWIVVLAVVVIIGGFSLLRRQQAQSVNLTGREWVENAAQGASNAEGRGMIPGSGGPPGAEAPTLPAPSQPGAGQLGAGAPAAGQPPTAPQPPAAGTVPGAASGRSAIPPSR